MSRPSIWSIALQTLGLVLLRTDIVGDDNTTQLTERCHVGAGLSFIDVHKAGSVNTPVTFPISTAYVKFNDKTMQGDIFLRIAFNQPAELCI